MGYLPYAGSYEIARARTTGREASSIQVAPLIVVADHEHLRPGYTGGAHPGKRKSSSMVECLVPIQPGRYRFKSCLLLSRTLIVGAYILLLQVFVLLQLVRETRIHRT